MNNFHSPYDNNTLFKPVYMNPPLEALDTAITYLKGIMVHCDGDLAYNPTSGLLSWSGIIRIWFTAANGTCLANYINPGSITINNGAFAYVDLIEVHEQTISMQSDYITGNALSKVLPNERLVMAAKNTSSGNLYLINLQSKFGVVAGQLPVRNRAITIAPEYAGAVLTASGSNNNPGSKGMTSDIVQVGNFVYGYYEWLSDLVVALQSYDLFVQMTIPTDFVALQTATNTALMIELCTQEDSNVNNALDISLQKNGALGSSSVTGLFSAAAGVWQIQGWNYNNAVLSALTPGDTLNIRIRMYSQNTKYVRVGKIYLNIQTQ